MDVLSKKIGGRQRRLTVNDVQIREVETREGATGEKLILMCLSPEGQEFLIDEALLEDHRDQEIRSKGLWVSTDGEGAIRARSIIAKTLQYYGVVTPQELEGQEITALPKKNNYLAIVIDDKVTDDTLPW